MGEMNENKETEFHCREEGIQRKRGDENEGDESVRKAKGHLLNMGNHQNNLHRQIIQGDPRMDGLDKTTSLLNPVCPAYDETMAKIISGGQGIKGRKRPEFVGDGLERPRHKFIQLCIKDSRRSKLVTPFNHEDSAHSHLLVELESAWVSSRLIMSIVLLFSIMFVISISFRFYASRV